MDELVWHVCDVIRTNQYVGIDESKACCMRCPQTVESPYGPGTQGCRLLAQDIIALVHRTDSSPGQK